MLLPFSKRISPLAMASSQMRTALPPSLSIRITARRFGDPVEKLLR